MLLCICLLVSKVDTDSVEPVLQSKVVEIEDVQVQAFELKSTIQTSVTFMWISKICEGLVKGETRSYCNNLKSSVEVLTGNIIREINELYKVKRVRRTPFGLALAVGGLLKLRAKYFTWLATTEAVKNLSYQDIATRN